MGLIVRMKTRGFLSLVLVVYAVYGMADKPANRESKVMRDRSNYSPLQLVVDYSNVNKTLRPAFSSINYAIGCGIQNSESPYKKITSDSDDGGKIVGGANANPGEFPWQISLQQITKNGNHHMCGGSIISENIIITAGHCVHRLGHSDIQVVAGVFNLYNFTGDEQVRAVKTILENGYDQKTFDRDIALLVLEKPLKLDRFRVAPVCLPDTTFAYNGVEGVITGWGRLSEGGKISPSLQVVSVPLVPPEKCSQSYASAGFASTIGKCQICSGSEEGGLDSCQGDSGGPLTCVESDGRHYVCGIVSWGIGCARPNYPGVYTFTPCFSKWIAEVISKHNLTAT